MSAVLLLIALGATILSSLCLALLLRVRARDMEGSGLLALFLLSVALFLSGQAVPLIWGGAGEAAAALTFVTAPFGSALFVHFLLIFLGSRTGRASLAAIYSVAGLGAMLGLGLGIGHVQPWVSLPAFFLPDIGGGLAAVASIILSVGGHLLIPLHWGRLSEGRKRQAVALGLAFFWGMICIGGFAFPALRLPLFPYPLLLMPLYAVILVYGLLRYRLMEVNLWARRGLAGALLAVLLMGGAALATGWAGAGGSFGRIWLACFGVLAAGALLWPGLRRLADRLVLGGQVTNQRLVEWRSALSACADMAALEREGEKLLGELIRSRGTVVVGARPTDGVPSIGLTRDGGSWGVELSGWEGAPPSPQVAARLLGELVAEQADRLDRAEAARLAERGSQQTARLAELGALAATVAHDLRNPLNIIAMAAATAPDDMKREISAQIARMSHLVNDLLDYAKPWSVTTVPLDLGAWCQGFAGSAEIAVPEGLTIAGDANRLRQAMVNLLANARALASRVAVFGARGGDGTVSIEVCDDGPGIPEEIRASLFEPFVSRSPDGTGLGLAIVAKVMAAHGGTVSLGVREGWSTCIVLSFPPSGDDR